VLLVRTIISRNDIGRATKGNMMRMIMFRSVMIFYEEND
jgi:hypothetical protein